VRPADPTSDPSALRDAAYAKLREDPASREAHLLLYEVEQMLGSPTAGVAHLRMALGGSRVLTTAAKATPAMAVLALYRIGPWEANLPFELVVDESRTTVHRLFISDEDDERLFDQALPPYDAVICAIAESDRAQHALTLAERFASRAAVPVINRPATVASLSRDRVRARFAGSRNVLAPPVERAPRAALAALQVGSALVVRPIGSQAGIDLARIEDNAALRDYLARDASEDYFVMPFVDYKSADGFYRKYRIMYVNGVPYPYHLAISPSWMIHYYNAPMQEHQWMRDEEERFIDDLGAAFPGKLAGAINEIARAIPLTYFGIDCSITPDRRVLLFEVDAAMLVHGTDDPAMFAYKRRAFERVQRALADAIDGIVAGTIALPA
jgi:hypothetical protein